MKKVFYVMEINPSGYYKRMVDIWSTRQKAWAQADKLNEERKSLLELSLVFRVYEATVDPDLDMLAKVAQRVAIFKTSNNGAMTHMMLREVKGQYIEMAQGGDGTCSMQGNIRAMHYPDSPDIYFQKVCDGMGWRWRK